MPDLQTELSKIASAWDTHEQTIRQPQQEKAMETFKPTGNSSRDAFDFIRVNHNIYTQNRAVAALVQMGYKKSSVSALFTQMKRAGLIAMDVDGHLFATRDAYTPVGSPYKAKPTRKSGRPKKSEGIAALPAAKVQEPRKQLVLKLTAEDVLSKLDVKEAYKLYQELRNMFGGK